ncbi:hypothetical protein TNCV_679481 [Trichonephila clavipes]|nr:hypothetical protein TNCV_679481 [Trichonephila clavipes]
MSRVVIFLEVPVAPIKEDARRYRDEAPGFHRSTNRHQATQQIGKHHFCHAQHHRLSRHGIDDCFTVQTSKGKRLFDAYGDES